MSPEVDWIAVARWSSRGVKPRTLDLGKKLLASEV